MNMKRLPIGISDFKKIIENNYYFVDTSNFIIDIYNEAADIVLLTRPRRFGKTLNMSMLRYFFDNLLNTASLFDGLAVSEDDEVIKQINGYPTIFITFKDFKDMKWDTAELKLKTLLSGLYNDFSEVVLPILKSKIEKKIYMEICNREAKFSDYQEGLKNLTKYLYVAYDKPVMLIIDEYDVPIQSGWTYGYYDDIIDFMRNFLSGALKDNPYLFKGVLTGIYRVAKESIFSGLNNLIVYTIFDEPFSTYFGFTEDEIQSLLQVMDLSTNKELTTELKNWYNGYTFGSNTIYNPWSIVRYLQEKKLKAYWINTSSNELIQESIKKNMKQKAKFREEIEALISGKPIKKMVDDSSALKELNIKPSAIWTLFLFSGYLKPKHAELVNAKYRCELEIPNREVLVFFQDTVIEWLSNSDVEIVYDMADSLIAGEGEKFCDELKTFVLDTLSYHDLKGEPENTYHMILLGMFAHLSDGYWIKSNRESGFGRYDILLKAKDKKNFSAVIEIKPSIEKAADGMEQIEEKAYSTELEAEGYTNILKIALGIDGKKVETLVEKRI
jgi:hypothetical protein